MPDRCIGGWKPSCTECMDGVCGGIPKSTVCVTAGYVEGFWRNKAVSAWGVRSGSFCRNMGAGSLGVPWSLGTLALLFRTLGALGGAG